MPVMWFPTLRGTASTARTRPPPPRNPGKRGSAGRSGEASASPRCSRKPITLMLTACGHDPDESPGVSRRMMVLTLDPAISGARSLMEPSSADSRPVVLWTIQSRIGCSSEFEATISHSSVTNWSSAWRRWASGVPVTPGAWVMGGPFDGGTRPGKSVGARSGPHKARVSERG